MPLNNLTSLSVVIACTFSRSNILLSITVPIGAKVLPLHMGGEAEILINRDEQFFVTNHSTRSIKACDNGIYKVIYIPKDVKIEYIYIWHFW